MPIINFRILKNRRCCRNCIYWFIDANSIGLEYEACKLDDSIDITDSTNSVCNNHEE